MCGICKHAASDGFEECPKCGKKFYRCPTCGQPWAEEPRNLAKPNAQPALSDVLAKIATKSENSIEFSNSEGEFCKVISVSDVEKILSEYFA